MTIRAQIGPGVEHGSAFPLSSGRAVLGAGAPLVTSAPPPVASPSSTCSRPWCDLPVFSRLTGRCEAHGEQDLDRLREYLDDVGRGVFES